MFTNQLKGKKARRTYKVLAWFTIIAMILSILPPVQPAPAAYSNYGNASIDSIISELSPNQQNAANASFHPALLAPDIAASPITMRGHVPLQGRSTPPDPSWSVLVTGTLRSGTNPSFDFTSMTDQSGYFTVTADLTPGNYQWRISSSQTLTNGGTVNLASGFNTLEMGTLRTGDTNNDNCIKASDEDFVDANAGRDIYNTAYNQQADLNGDDAVRASDYALIAPNLNTCGYGSISSVPPVALPPDPSAIAPPLNLSVATDLGTSSSFLYSPSVLTSTLIQTGVAANTVNTAHASVLRGKVLSTNGQPLSGAIVKVVDHPEFGQTLSRADGKFDMAVNGGGLLVVVFSKKSYLPVQRQAPTQWQHYTTLPDVVMNSSDSQVTLVKVRNATKMQVARGSVMSDSNGSRQQTLLFPAGASATMSMPDGTSRTLSTIHVRNTEYTVGSNGPKAVPADLPTNAGYTYSSEFSVDEATAVGADGVWFSNTVVSYVDNFLNFPVGTTVPSGYYDRSIAKAWIPSESGLVVRVLAPTNGLANLDVDGSGAPASDPTLAFLGVTTDERTALVSLYSVGTVLWRTRLSRSGAWNNDWSIDTPTGASEPDETPVPVSREYNPCGQIGGSAGCEDQTVDQDVNVTGTDFSLHYSSDTVPGRVALYTVPIPVTGDTLPPGLKRVELQVMVAGQISATTFLTPTANTVYTYTWDGKDIYGRTVQGGKPITVRIGNVFDAGYQQTDRYGNYGNGTTIAGVPGRQEVTLWKTWEDTIGPWDARLTGLGGWNPSNHHAYDPQAKVLYMGNGAKQNAQALPPVIVTVAGNGSFSQCFSPPCGNGSRATNVPLFDPEGVAVGPDGSLYIAETNNHKVWRVDPSGLIYAVAGTGVSGFSGDAGAATSARLNHPQRVAVGSDGSVYIADINNYRVRKVKPDGTIVTVAGSGSGGYSGDGGPATSAALQPNGISIGPDGSLYIGDLTQARVRRVDASGVINTVAGNGLPGFTGDNGPAGSARISAKTDVAAAPDGNLYIADTNNARVRRVAIDGTITTVAGGGNCGSPYCGDGGPAIAAQLTAPEGLTVGQDGSLYIVDSATRLVRRVGLDKIITTAAGSDCGANCPGSPGANGPATQGHLSTPKSVAAGLDGSIYLADSTNYLIRRLTIPLSGFASSDIPITSSDGSELYIFDRQGRHLRTVDTMTAAVRYVFTYTNSGALSSWEDLDNNVTTITRDGSGKPTGIVASYGQSTTLNADANGFLSRITDPAGETNVFTYTAAGLLTSTRDPNGNENSFNYDSQGRQSQSNGPAGGTTTSTRIESGNVYTVTETTVLTTGIAYTTTYQVENLPNGDSRRTTISPDGTRTVTLEGLNGTSGNTSPDGTVTTQTIGPDPRWGMLVPVSTSSITLLPSGLTQVMSSQREALLSNSTDLLSLRFLTGTSTLNGKTKTSVYDGVSRISTSTSPEGRQTFSTVDSKGRTIQSQTAGLDPSTTGYDNRGRVTFTTIGSGVNTRTTLNSYNALSYRDVVTDPIGLVTSYGYDAAGRVLTQTMTMSRVITNSYDLNGNNAGIKPPGYPVHNFTYTAVNQNQDYIPPIVPGSGANNTHYDYDPTGQMTKMTRPDGITVTYGYDSAGRQNLVSYPSGVISTTFRPSDGKVASIGGPAGVTLMFGYDGSLVTNTTWSGVISGSVGSSYDNDLREATQIVNGANPISATYDRDNLLTRAGAITLTHNLQNGLLTGTQLGAITDTFGYNPLGETTSYQAAYGGTNLLVQSYRRDSLGRIGTMTETISSTTHIYNYYYDDAKRLSEVWQDGRRISQYAYDLNGNRTSYTDTVGMVPVTITASYDNQDRLTLYGSEVYTYTANGELKTKQDSFGQLSNYGYDVLGNLITVTLPYTTTPITYIVDGKNRRVGKKVGDVLVQGFLYKDDLKPIAELDGNDNIVARFVYACCSNIPDYMIKNGNTYRIISDHLNSPRLVIDVATGIVAQALNYDEFGNVILDTNPGFQPFGFAGGLYDKDTKLVRFGARDYYAHIGRWTAKDPSRFGGGDTELYGYVGNDPTNGSDPSGLEGCNCEGLGNPLYILMDPWIRNNSFRAIMGHVPGSDDMPRLIRLLVKYRGIDNIYRSVLNSMLKVYMYDSPSMGYARVSFGGSYIYATGLLLNFGMVSRGKQDHNNAPNATYQIARLDFRDPTLGIKPQSCYFRACPPWGK